MISEDHLDLGSEKQVILERMTMALLKKNYEMEILMIYNVYIYMGPYIRFFLMFGQIIATSCDLTPKGS